MSLEQGFLWSHAGVDIRGYTMAGITTSLALPAAQTCFDVGQGLPFQLSQKDFFISHAHMDHASGLPYLIAQRTMMGQAPARIYAPEPLANELPKIMDIWGRLEDHQYDYELVTLEEGRRYPVKPPYMVRPFQTYHRIPSFGFTLFESRKKLRKEFQGRSRDEIRELLSKGITVDTMLEIPLFTYTGDTTMEVLDRAPEWALRAKILALDITFIDEKRPPESARQWGHGHLDELVPRLEDLPCEVLLLIHLSARYSSAYAQSRIEALPASLQKKLALFPRPI